MSDIGNTLTTVFKCWDDADEHLEGDEPTHEFLFYPARGHLILQVRDMSIIGQPFEKKLQRGQSYSCAVRRNEVDLLAKRLMAFVGPVWRP